MVDLSAPTNAPHEGLLATGSEGEERNRLEGAKLHQS